MSKPPFSITLIVATHNGAKSLGRSLASLQAVQVDQNVDFSVIYIDNNSTDTTSTVLKNHQSVHRFTVLSQPKRGKNTALNTIFEADVDLGDLLVFSDDDVLFPTDFAKQYAALANTHTDCDLFGGRVDAVWPEQPPTDLLNGVNAVVAFAITPEEAGYATGRIDPVKIHGPNMAVRKSVFDRGVRFNESIGPAAGNYMMGSETELLYRLKASGFQAYFQSELAVGHLIRPEQLTDQWLRNRAYRAGKSVMMHQRHNGSNGPVKTLRGYPRWALVSRYKNLLLRLMQLRKNELYYRALWKASQLRGYCDEFRSLHFACAPDRGSEP